VQQWAGRLATRGREGGAIRRLRAGVGRDIYGFKDGAGSFCLLYVGFASNCATLDDLRQTRARWTIGAGTLIALVTDDVEKVGLTVDGRSYPVSLINNVAFAQYDGGDSATIAVTDVRAAQSTTARFA
jgi:hypothetical protein